MSLSLWYQQNPLTWASCFLPLPPILALSFLLFIPPPRLYSPKLLSSPFVFLFPPFSFLCPLFVPFTWLFFLLFLQTIWSSTSCCVLTFLFIRLYFSHPYEFSYFSLVTSYFLFAILISFSFAQQSPPPPPPPLLSCPPSFSCCLWEL